MFYDPYEVSLVFIIKNKQQQNNNNKTLPELWEQWKWEWHSLQDKSPASEHNLHTISPTQPCLPEVSTDAAGRFLHPIHSFATSLRLPGRCHSVPSLWWLFWKDDISLWQVFRKQTERSLKMPLICPFPAQNNVGMFCKPKGEGWAEAHLQLLKASSPTAVTGGISYHLALPTKTAQLSHHHLTLPFRSKILLAQTSTG